MASHIVINVSWDGSLALKAGSGKVHIWTKSSFDETGSPIDVVSMPCGSVLPVINTSALAGNKKILPEIPDAAWEHANMPTFAGTMERNGSTQTVTPGVALLGLSMTDPTGAWPSRTSITGVDHDGDGKLGVTAIPKTDSGFSAPPTSLSQSSVVDRMYLATRNQMTMQATVEGCPDTITGTANVTKFDNHVIGCRVKGGGECNATEAKFVDDNRTVYKLGSATFTSTRVDDDATCAEVRAALPIE